jgi:hypothetical protein
VFRKSDTSPVRNLFIIPASLLALSGCLTEGQVDEPEGSAVDNSSGEIIKNHELLGSVGDGPIVNAEVRISSSDGESLGSANGGNYGCEKHTVLDMIFDRAVLAASVLICLLTSSSVSDPRPPSELWPVSIGISGKWQALQT